MPSTLFATATHNGHAERVCERAPHKHCRQAHANPAELLVASPCHVLPLLPNRLLVVVLMPPAWTENARILGTRPSAPMKPFLSFTSFDPSPWKPHRRHLRSSLAVTPFPAIAAAVEASPPPRCADWPLWSRPHLGRRRSEQPPPLSLHACTYGCHAHAHTSPICT